MPKINATHLTERLQDHITKMERGEEVEAKKDKTLLSSQWQQALKDALQAQKALKKSHKRPKTQAEKDALGWKEIREVRLEIYRQALVELKEDMHLHLRELQHQGEVKAARVFMDAWSRAIKDGKDGLSAMITGQIAQTRAGFDPKQSVGLTKRDREIQQMEEAILKQLANQSSQSDKQQKIVTKKAAKTMASKQKGK
jgi:hypothetical protein